MKDAPLLVAMSSDTRGSSRHIALSAAKSSPSPPHAHPRNLDGTDAGKPR